MPSPIKLTSFSKRYPQSNFKLGKYQEVEKMEVLNFFYGKLDQ